MALLAADPRHEFLVGFAIPVATPSTPKVYFGLSWRYSIPGGALSAFPGTVAPMRPALFCFLALFALGAGCNCKPADVPDAGAPVLPLSALAASQQAPTYTTYAAARSRSQFWPDEGYRLVYHRKDMPIAFDTDTAGTLAVAFVLDGKLVGKTDDFATKPTLARSYFDSGELTYAPFSDVQVTHDFSVYSSTALLEELWVANTGAAAKTVTLLFTLELTGLSSFVSEAPPASGDRVTFAHDEVEQWSSSKPTLLRDLLLTDAPADSWRGSDVDAATLWREVTNGTAPSPVAGTRHAVLFSRVLSLEPGQSRSVRVVRAVQLRSADPAKLAAEAEPLLSAPSFADLFAESERAYERIPKLAIADRGEQLAYWQAFSLVHQVFLPPEGTLHHNYYVFSREPTWGFGHAGQVFHESLSLLAYVYMDPTAALESQRVFMERQHADGYIYYRLGPYVADDFPLGNDLTTSAPFYAWTNWELFRATQDRDFLAEAYGSSSRFMGWLLANRDKDGDGLYEWGAQGVLESVRDGYNIVWQAVGTGWDAPKSVEALDLSCMMVKELRSLASMATELSLPTEAADWNQRADAISRRINEVMWDEPSGFYYHVDKGTNAFINPKGVDLRRMEIIGFLPMWAGVAPPDRAARLMQHLTNPAKFWRKYGVPTVAADDPGYVGQPLGCCQWDGPLWLLWDYMVFRGLWDYGYTAEAEELVHRNFAIAVTKLKTDHVFYESYNPDGPEMHGLSPYLWDAILGRMQLDLATMHADGGTP